MDEQYSCRTGGFFKENIQPILLKGQGLAICYENPAEEFVEISIGIFWTTDEFYKADKLFAKYGIVTEATAGYSSFISGEIGNRSSPEVI